MFWGRPPSRGSCILRPPRLVCHAPRPRPAPQPSYLCARQAPVLGPLPAWALPASETPGAAVLTPGLWPGPPAAPFGAPTTPKSYRSPPSLRPASSCLPPAAPRRRVPCQLNAGGVRGPGGQSEITGRGAVMGQSRVQPGQTRRLDKPRPLTPAAPGHLGGGPGAWARALGPQTPDLAAAWQHAPPPSPRGSAGGICGSQSRAGWEEGVRGERHLPWGGGRAAAACGLTASTQEAAAPAWGPGRPLSWAPAPGGRVSPAEVSSPGAGVPSPARPGPARHSWWGGLRDGCPRTTVSS